MKHSRAWNILCAVSAVGAGIVFFWRAIVPPEAAPGMVPGGAQNDLLPAAVGAVLAAGLIWLLLRGLLALWHRR